jgi:hypothetical protein
MFDLKASLRGLTGEGLQDAAKNDRSAGSKTGGHPPELLANTPWRDMASESDLLPALGSSESVPIALHKRCTRTPVIGLPHGTDEFQLIRVDRTQSHHHVSLRGLLL